MFLAGVAVHVQLFGIANRDQQHRYFEDHQNDCHPENQTPKSKRGLAMFHSDFIQVSKLTPWKICSCATFHISLLKVQSVFGEPVLEEERTSGGKELTLRVSEGDDEHVEDQSLKEHD